MGRDAILDGAAVDLGRLLSHRTVQHRLVTGLRGVGKTVLLRALAAQAEQIGFNVVRVEASRTDDAMSALLRQVTRIVEDLEGRSGEFFRSLESISVNVAGTGFSIDRFDPEQLRSSVLDLIIKAANSTQAHSSGLMLSIDEAQQMDSDNLSQVLAAAHRASQDGLPFYLAVAGLPNLIRHVADASTYAERMFQVDELGPLSPDEVGRAVMAPARELGVHWSDAAAHAVADRTNGYPFFVQTWAFHTWNTAKDEPISQSDVERASARAERSLETAFFVSRLARIPESEFAYVSALASLGPGPHRSGDVAAAMAMKTTQVAAFRSRLIDEGIIYPPRYGWVEFAIPHFDRYILKTVRPNAGPRKP